MNAKRLISELKRHKIGPYIEVPCSILAPVISALEANGSYEVMNPVNEAVAMGLASGSHLATGRIPMVLMQNSGLCNTLNALTSLNSIYRIPVLYLISWRGEPGSDDAPEHDVIGAKLKDLLGLLGVPYAILSVEGFRRQISKMVDYAKRNSRPAALILRDRIIDEEMLVYPMQSHLINKEDAIDIIMETTRTDKVCFVTTNGFISREVYNNLSKKGIERSNPPFYMLGSMGHALAIGIGLGRHIKDRRKVIVLDGDGGCLMHLGSMASVDKRRDRKLVHIVLDDGVYASTGGQSTLSRSIDLCKIAEGCGYKDIFELGDSGELRKRLIKTMARPGPAFIRILIDGVDKTAAKARISNDHSCEGLKVRFMTNLGVKSQR